MNDLSHLLTVPAAAQELGVTQGAVRIAISEGRMPSRVVVGRKVITREDLDAYKQRTRPGGLKPKGRPQGSRLPGGTAMSQGTDAQDL